jgi:hypothetical protein
MFEHFRQFFAKERNRTAIFLILGFIIFLAILKHYDLYDGFKNKKGSSHKKGSVTNRG